MEKVKIGCATLIKQFFGLTLQEARAELATLTEKDKIELASSIARERGIVQEDCKIELVEY